MLESGQVPGTCMGIPCCFLTWIHACGWSTAMADPHFHHQMVSREMFKTLQSTGAPGAQAEAREKAGEAGVPQVQ